MGVELKPCPHCGGEAAMQTRDGSNGLIYHYVICIRCEAGTDWVDDTDAARVWNTRALVHPEMSRTEPIPGTFMLRADMTLPEAANLLRLCNDGRDGELPGAILAKFPELVGKDEIQLLEISCGRE